MWAPCKGHGKEVVQERGARPTSDQASEGPWQLSVVMGQTPSWVSVSSLSWFIPKSRDKVKAESTVRWTTTAPEVGSQDVDRTVCYLLATQSVNCRRVSWVLWKADMESRERWGNASMKCPPGNVSVNPVGVQGKDCPAQESHGGWKCQTLRPTPCFAIGSRRGALWRPSLCFQSGHRRADMRLPFNHMFYSWAVSPFLQENLSHTALILPQGPSSVCIPRELVRNAESWALSGNTLHQDLQFNKVSRWFVFYCRVWETQNSIQGTKRGRLRTVAHQRIRVLEPMPGWDLIKDCFQMLGGARNTGGAC